MITEDTFAYGVDQRHQPARRREGEVRTHIKDMARELGPLGAWIRLYYLYPYDHVDDLIPLMVDGLTLRYLDIPFQRASPSVLRAMWRPANEAKVLARISNWRAICPEITMRSTFIVGFPGETEEDFSYRLDWLEEALLDRIGCFQYEDVSGAVANDLAEQIPTEVKHVRWERFMEAAQRISTKKLAVRAGTRLPAIVDEVDEEAAICRTMGDAPEFDGNLFVDTGHADLTPEDIIKVEVDEASGYDLWGRLV